ncbi:branched-chain amino acid ABC transporter permease [Sulfuritalea hydrogenivorans]|uniref:ABC-transporter n=1 Tax=Sulfuritalea hydrogenivorans sk43H TaxID=1223802 RepID=W0SFC6_9PROT|nr:branched-chain amino acid ABC transporter permease [Sulfuritalea hydrogenivorans]MDK9715575.1 branched-chain amino acid ABC transporter permease [Sulfuritalea sp.]BAO29455.1 ABC-transporter [Sulfuritalea hydrogenivorans sk43H]
MENHRLTNWLPYVVLGLLALFPLVESTFYTQLLTKVLIMAIFAMSLDLLVGYTGLVSFGHAAYFGLAGYALALLAPKYEAVSLWWSLPAAMGVCALFALVTGTLVLRTRGIYFIMVTLAFAQMLFFIFHDTKIGGGSDGIYIYAKPTMKLGEFQLLDLEKLENFYWLALALTGAAYLLLRRVLGSTFGRALLGIKVNEHRMRALGFPVFRYQLASFILSGALAGLAGYLAAVQYGFVNPEILSWHQSGAVLMMVILGGMGTLHGPVVGAFAFVLLQEVLSNQAWFGPSAKHWQLAMGIFVMLVALYLPQGLAGLAQRFGRKPMAEAADE